MVVHHRGHFPHCLKLVFAETKSGYAMLLQWCSELLKLSWAQSVCVLAGCNLQPRVECELPTLCRDQCCGCSWHLLRRPLRNRHNNVPFTGQMMSNCEEEFGQEGQEKGEKRQGRLMDLRGKKKPNKKISSKLQQDLCNSFHALFIECLPMNSISLDFLHNQFFLISTERQIRVVVCS